MTIYTSVIAASWLAFMLVWTVTAFSAKPSANAGRTWWGWGASRLGIVALVLLALRVPALHHDLRAIQPAWVVSNPDLGILGAALCVAGVGLAVWARLILGRNWGMPMTRKQNPELITAGPYGVIRHPIYTGMLIAMLGSMLGGSTLVSLPLVIVGGYFIYSARREEKLMLEQFPTVYPAYMKRTKMLLPFIF